MAARILGVAVSICFLLGTATAETTPPRPDPAAALAGLDAVIDQALQDQKIPGAAVGVVVGDEVVLLKGYGYRDLENRQPMTPDTILPIASVSKQLTVAALATLVRRGKLDWDRPVRDVMPEFRLHDDYATLHATPRDLVTHRIGLPRHDLAWFGSPLSREEIYGNLRYFDFSRDIRTRFQYNNLMFMAAGFLGGRVAGSSWEELVRQSIFEPLAMRRSSFSLADLARDPDHAKGYQLGAKRQIVPSPFESSEAIGPAGGVNSTARDLVQYLRMMLAGGTFEGRRVLLEGDVQAMMQPAVPVGTATFPEFGFLSYGMGLFVETYRGFETARHGGDMPGAAVQVVLVPKEHIGIVVLTNRSYAVLRDGLPYEIIDRLLGLPSADLIRRNAEVEAKTLAGEEAAKAEGATGRKPGTRPAHPLADYAGDYSHPGYGTARIDLEKNRLFLTYHGFKTPLDHWHYEVFRAPQDPTNRLDLVRLQFETDLDGDVSSLAIPFEPEVSPIHFTRQPPREMLDPAFLKEFAGAYELAGVDAEIALREDNVLQLIRRGHAYELIPVRGTTFKIKDQASVTIEFLRDGTGKVNRFARHGETDAIATKKND
ncbi:MAG TPA: serine hydrolase [Thermoanaerobaculia bacterium]|nr:serine hydrolase [Thermoanaerobaculia bacterium]